MQRVVETPASGGTVLREPVKLRPPPGEQIFATGPITSGMNWWKVLGYGAVAVGVLWLLQFVVSLIFSILSLVWTVITTAVALLALAGLLYGGYRLLSWVRDTESADSADDSETGREPANRVETLKERYTNGELSEEEFERRLERELDGPERLESERVRGRE
jgi:uncharacterized membrane protein